LEEIYWTWVEMKTTDGLLPEVWRRDKIQTFREELGFWRDVIWTLVDKGAESGLCPEEDRGMQARLFGSFQVKGGQREESRWWSPKWVPLSLSFPFLLFPLS
jgi:hypothetical protein